MFFKELIGGAETGVQTRTGTVPQRTAAGQVAPGGAVAVPRVQEHPVGTDAWQETEDGSCVLDAGSKKWRDVLLLLRLVGLLGAPNNIREERL